MRKITEVTKDDKSGEIFVDDKDDSIYWVLSNEDHEKYCVFTRAILMKG